MGTSVSEKKKEILNTALTIIQADGYAALTMRNLANASAMKLGSLQYHFKTRDELIEAIADHILDEYSTLWNSSNDVFETVSLPVFIDFLLGNIALLESARLWPQLWAWGLVEPRMKCMLEKIYEPYMQFMIKKFTELGCSNPKLEGLAMMSMLEGATIFIGRGASFENDLEAVKCNIIESLESRFGEAISSS